MNNKYKLIFISIFTLATGSLLLWFDVLDLTYLLRKKTSMEIDHKGCVWGVSHVSNNAQKKYLISNVYSLFQDNFPRWLLKDTDEKSIIIITWEPFDKQDKSKSILHDIASGIYDEHILKFALEAKLFRNKIILRFGHEMNGDWYPWGGINNGMSTTPYIHSFKRIHHIFKEQKVVNVLFAFSVNGNDVPSDHWNRFENYYPGDDIVDLIMIDVYNRAKNPTSPKSLLKAPYERIIKSFPNKPIMIGEIGSGSKNINKAVWIDELFSVVQERFPAIKAMIWFDMNKEEDWAISDNPVFEKIILSKTKEPHYNIVIDNLNWMFKDEKK